MGPEDIISFWFEAHGPKDWFGKDAQFDEAIRTRFLTLYEEAARGETAAFRDTPEGRLAEVLLLDQFPRNLFRGEARAFATDAQALTLAREAVRCGADALVEPLRRQFFYMPYMHSESLPVHDEGLALFERLGNEHALRYERAHREIVERFGRYPHRNTALGRTSSPEEKAFLEANEGF